MKISTQYINKIQESKELKIIELSYFNFINLCDIYETVNIKDKYGLTLCNIIKQVKDQPEIFSNKSNKYHFLAAIKNDKLLGIFYKQLIGNPNTYDVGYIISKGAAKELLSKMRKLGSYTTFSNINNIGSIKSQLAIGGKIICICDNAPNKSDGSYNKKFDDIIKELLMDKKLYYRDGVEEFYFLDKKGNLKINELKDFLLTHDKIKIIDKAKIGDKIKIYFLFKKL